jgi:hypothetical protein
MTNQPIVLQPISTAPKDRTWILVAGESGYGSTPLRFSVCRYISDYSDPWRNHANDGFTDGGPEPIYWMPLPIAQPINLNHDSSVR